MPHLPPPPGISDEGERLLAARWHTIDRVLKRLAEKGVTIPDNPPPFPIPEVETTLVDTDNQEYLKTNAKYLAWINYVLPHISLNEAILLQVRNEKANIEVLYRDAARQANEGLPPNKRQSKEEIEDNIHLDPRYVELTLFEQELMQETLLLEDQKERLARVLRVISRHIEVKKLDVEATRIVANAPQRRPFTRPNFGQEGTE